LDRLGKASRIVRFLPKTTKVNRFDSTPKNGKMIKINKKNMINGDKMGRRAGNFVEWLQDATLTTWLQIDGHG
jgi:hypothetical protein